MKAFFYSFTVILFLLSACSEEEKIKPRVDLQAPEISIYSPTAQQKVTEGNLRIFFEVTENDQLHNLGWIIRNEEGSSLQQWQGHEHKVKVAVDTVVQVATSEETQCTLTVIATDHNGNRTEESTSFLLMP